MTKLKKQREQYALDRFLSCSNLDLKLNSIDDDRETPDFVLYCDNQTISLEHTGFINKRQKEVEQFRKRIIGKAKSIFETTYNTKLSVGFNFSNIEMNTKIKSEDFFVQMLADMVSEIYVLNKERDFYVSTKINKRENKYIRNISVNNDRRIYPWEITGAYLVEPADLQVLQSIIDEKSELIKKYNVEVDEKWLLIEAGMGNKSSGYSFEHKKGLLKRQDFERVFFFDSGVKEYLEL